MALEELRFAETPVESSVTEAQREIWLATQLDREASVAFIESYTIRLEGRLDQEAMRRAIRAVVSRHDALRARFSPEGELQYFESGDHLEIPVQDFSDLPAEERAARARAALEAEANRPFDLAKGPVVRFRLLKLSEEEHWLMFSAHQIACDRSSCGVVLRELGQLLSAFRLGRDDPLPPAASFRDYVEWLDSGEADRSESDVYWSTRYQKPPGVMDLPLDRPRPPLRSYRGARRSFTLSSPLWRAIHDVAADRGTSPFAVLLAAFGTLLYRLSGQSDLVVGVRGAGHEIWGRSDLVGHCAGLLPLRLELESDSPFAEFLTAVHREMHEAREHPARSLASLLNALKLEPDPSRVPLAPVCFHFDRSLSEIEFQGLLCEIEPNPRQACEFELSFTVVQTRDSGQVLCEYNSDLFDDETIERWLSHYGELLQDIARSPETSIDRLSILSPLERKTLVSEWNRTETAFARDSTIHSLIEEQVGKTPRRIAVQCGDRQLSYADLNRRANGLAAVLQRTGAGPGTPIGIYLHRSVDMLVALLGILKAGGAYVPLDPSFPRKRLATMVEDAALPILVTEEALANDLPPHGAAVVRTDRCDPSDEDEGRLEGVRAPHAERLAYVLFTSGSTGRPKGVEISHRSLVNLVQSMSGTPGFGEEDVLLAVTTLSFDIAALELFLPLITGARVVIASQKESADGHQLARLIEQHGITVMQGTPATWRLLLGTGWAGRKQLRILCGGEALPADLAQALLPRCAELWNMYGPTETTIWSTCCQVTSGKSAPSVGRPIANTSVYILDRHLQPVPIGVPGELYIGGEGVALGYLGRPELTRERFIPDSFSEQTDARLYRTGDLARYRADGDIVILGRLDNQVKIRGFRIELGEIEAAIGGCSGVRENVVMAIRDQAGLSRLVAYCRLDATSDPRVDWKGDIRARLREVLPEYMVPTTFMLMDDLPRTPNGKIDRQALPEPDTAPDVTETEYEAPVGATAETLAGIWSRVLQTTRVGRRDDFFLLGGHSLLAVQLFDAIEEEFGCRLPVATLFSAPTVEELARVIDSANTGSRRESDPDHSLLVPIRAEGDRVPFFCVHGAGGNVLLYRELVRHLGAGYPFYGLQSRGLDGRHPPLTTVEDMAAAYLDQIRKVRPSGPYCLGGYCMGGMVAFEIARRLRQNGESVPLVALMDTYNLNLALEASSRALLFQKLKFHMGNLIGLEPRELARYLQEKIRVARDGELSNLLGQLFGSAKPRKEPGTKVEVSVQAVNDKASISYQPEPYGGKLTLFKPNVNYSFFPDPEMGWGELALEGLEIVNLPVNPHAMLVDPFVVHLAHELRQRIDRVKA